MADIEDDQCDLETLAAILDDDIEDDTQPTKIETQNPPVKGDDLCFSDSDDEAGLEALASMMEEDSKAPSEGNTSGHFQGKIDTSPNNSLRQNDRSSASVSASKQPVVNHSPQNEETAKLQEELRQMKEQMALLQQQVLQSQQTQAPASQPEELFSEALSKGENSRQPRQQACPPHLSKTKRLSNGNSVQQDRKSEELFSPKAKGNSVLRSVMGKTEKDDASFPDSDSDWEDMDGEKSADLSKEGMELKKLLKGGTRKRVAHTSSYSPSVFKKQIPEAKWKTKPTTEQPKSSAVSLEAKFMSDKEDVMMFAGIRIINPKVSSEMLRIKMEGRKVMKMSRHVYNIKKNDLEGNWVTFGVLVHKSESRKSSNGNNYAIWKLSDLEDVEKTMTFFLFRDVYKHHWKCQQGTVLGLLNPNLMQKAEKFQSEDSFTIDHPGQMLILGQSKDLGSCKGTTKAGKVCNNFINKRQSEYCTYHVQSAYKKTSAKRSDLQSGFSGVAPKAYNKKIIPTGSHVFYGGQTFSTLPSCAVSSSKKGVSLKQLQQHNSSASKGKVTTLSLHELDRSGDTKVTGANGLKEQPFLDFLSTPTVGSLNLVKHLVKKETTTEKQPGTAPVVMSVSPAQLLKQHKQQANELKRRQAAKLKTGDKSSNIQSGPQLGRGFKPGQDIFFGSPPRKPLNNHNSAPHPSYPNHVEIAKKRAIAKVLSKGGISKEDPNAVGKTKRSPQSEQRVRKRVADQLENDPEEVDTTEPPQKKSRYLGNVDLKSEAVQKLLKAKSSHAGALAELEAERQDKYFVELEKKEQCEQQMLGITEIKCTAYTCHQCKYTALSCSDLCKAEGHKVSRIKGMKRFFKCQDCNSRTMSLHRYPKLPCRSCKGKSFVKTSMWKEKEGPKLESEILHVTGDTQKHLDSQIK